MKIGIVVPHIFMHPQILPDVIFSPGHLAIQLAEGLQAAGENVTLFTPGKVKTSVPVITPDLSYFEQELAARGDTYIDLLKKHAFTFVTLARQVQSELLARAFAMANAGQLDIVHVYCNEEDVALPFAQFCKKPVVFTHHDPFNFLAKYKSVFPKYAHLNWLSMSDAQRAGMPANTHWVAKIYHGLAANMFAPVLKPAPAAGQNYVAYAGRIIEPKGVHLAIAAVREYNRQHPHNTLVLKIAGKHYSDAQKDAYWYTKILPELGDDVEYVGFIKNNAAKNKFIGNAQALLVPSIFDEPFGMVSIEALACATPVVALDSGALPEVVDGGKTGFVIKKQWLKKVETPENAQTGVQNQTTGLAKDPRQLDTAATAKLMAEAIANLPKISRAACRQQFEKRFTLQNMIAGHQAAYQKLIR